MQHIHRHGDVSLIPQEEIKKLKEVYKGNSYVLAYGEQTGHKHLLETKEAAGIAILQDEATGKFYLKVNAPASLSHEEHKTQEVQQGFYLISNEREYDYFSLATRRVVD